MTRRSARLLAAALVLATCSCKYLPPVPTNFGTSDKLYKDCYNALVAKRSSALRAQIIFTSLALPGGLLGVGGGVLSLKEGSVDPQTMKAEKNYSAAATSGVGGLIVLVSQIAEPATDATGRYQSALEAYYSAVYGTGGESSLVKCAL